MVNPLGYGMPSTLVSEVDPFIGCAATELPPPEGLAKTWWWPKPQVGNTHPGACSPFGMVSLCPYSGAYPTGYGLYDKGTEGSPVPLYDEYSATGFTHFQQSGTGAIRKYYNYFRVTPLTGPLADIGLRFRLDDEHATPGYYTASLRETGVVAELTVAEKAAVHRYTFPQEGIGRLVIDFSCGGLALEHGRTLPSRADMELVGPGMAQGTVVMEGVPLSVFIRLSKQDLRQSVWYGKQAVEGGTRLVFDYIRETTLRSFGLVFSGHFRAGEQVELCVGFSLRGVEQARENCESQTGGGFDAVRGVTERAWERHLSRMRVEGGDESQRRTFYTALYHSLIKPCFAADESPFWKTSGPFVFDICTMWDIYKTQLPLLGLVYPERSVQLLNALIRVREEEGNFPIGYRMARGADRFYRQASALCHTALADAKALRLPGIDWEWALSHMHGDLLRTYGEEFAEKGVVHPITHTLDLAYGYFCSAKVARALDDEALALRLERHAAHWKHAYDPSTGLLVDSTYYEGTRYNYSFRLLHDMAGRIALSGGEEGFVKQLDEFFGYGAAPVRQLGRPPFGSALEEGYALGRFEGLNNEPDMEVPYAYYYAGRPDRTAEVVADILRYQFSDGRGGLPGNDDSGGLSSWYVWASVGLFPVAGQSVFLISVPQFPKVTLQIGASEFRIVRRNTTENCKYVTRATLNGDLLERTHLVGQELLRGGELVVELGDSPSSWGGASRPPSVSTG